MPLIITNEVIRNSFSDREYPRDKVERVRPIVESNYIRNCLGVDFYNLLLADVNDWSTVTEWTAGTYAINTIKFWNGLVLKSTINNNSSEPSLTNTTWIAADKFDESAYCDLWNKYLCQLIANKIIEQVAVSDTIRFSAKGRSINIYDNSNSGIPDNKGIMLALKSLENYIDILQDEMINYINEEYKKFQANPATGFDYSEVSFIKEGCESCVTTGNKFTRKLMMRY